MAIDLNGINITKLNTQSERAEQHTREAKQSKGREQGDQVELSRNAHSLEKLEQRIRSTETFDSERVEALAKAIGEGSYPVNSERIAEKFLELESQLY